MSFELQRKLLMSSVFKDYYRDALDGENAYKGKIWPLKVVKNTCNELLEGFLKSKRSRFKDYFKTAVKKKFAKKRSKQRMISFILTLFFSIEKRADECFELDILKSFFTSEWKKSVFKNWMKARKAIFRAKGLNYSTEVQLDELFLTKSEVLILAQKTCNESVEVFDKWLEDEIAYVKELRVKVKRGGEHELAPLLEKNQKFYRMDRTASSAVLWKIMRYFFKIEINQMEQEKRAEVEKKLSNMMQAATDEVIEIDDDGNIIANDRVSRASSINNDFDKEQELANMEMEKEALVKEIERNHREANLKYQACVLMAGFARATQEVFSESKEGLEDTGVVLKEYIDEVEDEEVKKRMFHQMGGFFGKEFFDKGSKLYCTAFDDMQKTLKKTPNMIQFNVDIEHRSRSYGTHCSNFEKLMRFVVHQDEMRFKLKKLSKKEIEQKNLNHILKGVEQSEYRLKNIKIEKERANNELVDDSVKIEDEIHEIVDEEDEYRMRLLTQKLEEQVKVDKKYLEDPEFTSSIGIKTKPNKFKNYMRQLSRVSESASEANSRVTKEKEGKEEENGEGGLKKSVIDENVSGEDVKTNRTNNLKEEQGEEKVEAPAEEEKVEAPAEEEKVAVEEAEVQKTEEEQVEKVEEQEGDKPKPEAEEQNGEEPKPGLEEAVQEDVPVANPEEEAAQDPEKEEEEEKGFMEKLKDMAKEAVSDQIDDV